MPVSSFNCEETTDGRYLRPAAIALCWSLLLQLNAVAAPPPARQSTGSPPATQDVGNAKEANEQKLLETIRKHLIELQEAVIANASKERKRELGHNVAAVVEALQAEREASMWGVTRLEYFQILLEVSGTYPEQRFWLYATRASYGTPRIPKNLMAAAALGPYDPPPQHRREPIGISGAAATSRAASRRGSVGAMSTRRIGIYSKTGCVLIGVVIQRTSARTRWT